MASSSSSLAPPPAPAPVLPPPITNIYNIDFVPLFYRHQEDDYTLFEKRLILILLDKYADMTDIDDAYHVSLVTAANTANDTANTANAAATAATAAAAAKKTAAKKAIAAAAAVAAAAAANAVANAANAAVVPNTTQKTAINTFITNNKESNYISFNENIHDHLKLDINILKIINNKYLTDKILTSSPTEIRKAFKINLNQLTEFFRLYDTCHDFLVNSSRNSEKIRFNEIYEIFNFDNTNEKLKHDIQLLFDYTEKVEDNILNKSIDYNTVLKNDNLAGIYKNTMISSKNNKYIALSTILKNLQTLHLYRDNDIKFYTDAGAEPANEYNKQSFKNIYTNYSTNINTFFKKNIDEATTGVREDDIRLSTIVGTYLVEYIKNTVRKYNTGTIPIDANTSMKLTTIPPLPTPTPIPLPHLSSPLTLTYYMDEYYISRTPPITKSICKFNLINNGTKDELKIKFNISCNNIETIDFNININTNKYISTSVSVLAELLHDIIHYNMSSKPTVKKFMDDFIILFKNKVYIKKPHAEVSITMTNIDTAQFMNINIKNTIIRFICSLKRSGDWGQIQLVKYINTYELLEPRVFNLNVSINGIITTFKTDYLKTLLSTLDKPCFLVATRFVGLNTIYIPVGSGSISAYDKYDATTGICRDIIKYKSMTPSTDESTKSAVKLLPASSASASSAPSASASSASASSAPSSSAPSSSAPSSSGTLTVTATRITRQTKKSSTNKYNLNGGGNDLESSYTELNEAITTYNNSVNDPQIDSSIKKNLYDNVKILYDNVKTLEFNILYNNFFVESNNFMSSISNILYDDDEDANKSMRGLFLSKLNLYITPDDKLTSNDPNIVPHLAYIHDVLTNFYENNRYKDSLISIYLNYNISDETDEPMDDSIDVIMMDTNTVDNSKAVIKQDTIMMDTNTVDNSKVVETPPNDPIQYLNTVSALQEDTTIINSPDGDINMSYTKPDMSNFKLEQSTDKNPPTDENSPNKRLSDNPFKVPEPKRQRKKGEFKQAQQKYLKYKSKYINLKKEMEKLNLI